MKKLICIFILLNIITITAFAQVSANQLGYLPESRKFAYFQKEADTFSLVDKSTGKTVFTGKVTLETKNDPATGQTIYVGDFSEFQTPGDYLIKAPDNGQSYPFTIGTEIYDKLYDESLKTFYIQRCGMELKSEFAGDFAHPACHTDAAKYYPDVNKAGTRNVPGGWHDAGDYGRYIVNGAYSVAVMLTGYEHFPKGFQSDNIGIPESGNSIPDLLDEIRYEIEWMLKMQDEDGGLFHKVTEPAFQALDLKPHEDEKTQVIMIKTSAATADFAIATAMAGRIYLQYDKTFADQCKAAALKAWEYLENHPDNVPKGGFRNPADIRTGTYGDADDADERFWAAVELYRTFQEKKFGKYIAKNIDDVNLFPEEIAWRDVAPFGVVNYLKFVEGDPDFMQKLTGKLKHFCNDMLSRYETNGYGILLNPGDYRWGSLQIDLNFGFILLAGGYIFDNEDFKRAATHQIHYMLGANGLDQSFVTGFGERSPQDVHNRICSLTDNWSIYPGFLVGGPNENLEDPALQKTFDKSTPPALCYVDNRDSYASNETCINWSAILVVYAGYLKGLE